MDKSGWNAVVRLGQSWVRLLNCVIANNSNFGVYLNGVPSANIVRSTISFNVQGIFNDQPVGTLNLNSNVFSNRSEERRVGKECQIRLAPEPCKKTHGKDGNVQH